jgi:hypothetical protein
MACCLAIHPFLELIFKAGQPDFYPWSWNGSGHSFDLF